MFVTYLQLDVFAIFLCIFLFFHNRKKTIQVKESKLFDKFLLINSVMAFLDVCAWAIDTGFINATPEIYHGIMSLYYVVQVLFAFQLLLYSFSYSRIECHWTVKMIIYIPIVISIVAVIYNIFYKNVFYVDEYCVYYRGSQFLLVAVAPMIYLVLSFGLVAYYCFFTKKRNQEERMTNLHMLSFILFPLGASVLSFIYSSVLIWPIITVAAVYLYLTVHGRQEAILEAEIDQIRHGIMMEQIQPDYVRNQIDYIQKLIMQRPREAQTCLYYFEEYLCKMIELYNDKRMISFDEEYEIVKNYLEMARIKHRDHLKIKYNIQSKDFKIPSLTILPLVENCINYGLVENRTTIVSLSAVEEETEYVIVVADDGGGFDMEKVVDGNMIMEGILGVEKRLNAVNGGELEVHSELHLGTTITIRIPKKVTNEVTDYQIN